MKVDNLMKYQVIYKNRLFLLLHMVNDYVRYIVSANTSGFENTVVSLIDIMTKFIGFEP